MQNIMTSNPVSSGADIKLLVVDIDGTIAGKSNNIREAVKQAIFAAQSRGVQVAVATGRMYRSALRFHRDIGSTLPLISYQGAWIQDPASQKMLRHQPLSKQTALELLEHFEEPDLRSLLSVNFYINDQLYVPEITAATKLYAERSGIQPIAITDLRRNIPGEPTKVLALCENPGVLDGLLSSMRERYTPAELYLTRSVATFFEATHPLVNKGAAVQYIAEDLLGLQPENVMAIGDNFNDVEMISYAGVGVAMGNAPSEVKAGANWVAPDVEEDGVAAAIAQFILGS
ncbi:MAG: HAD family phosphatase [Oscillatoriales cyanobacterium]|nr:MAG: HAD family phosphatase [Oscillatoriales cyanobacterium]TAD96226.1 MAG: HAD family phosphatase [Oscillatoriales cyanobacterium]TAE04003.1 MAG: HAD family phosphatase [Oscillatoriales cyanobacterium]TAF03346.1 MAG: HAD family phosphatase [Oscillatoriales cyanobacterium]TAF45193.1 MAG: HAD family phosphatase [Oscillatoriales cyanobacterium]